MENFDGFGLHPLLVSSLKHMGYTKPTPIQEHAIPLALKGRDIMGSAQTGTGKTAAFGIPLVEMLLRNPQGSALVMTPTRELGKQVMEALVALLGPKSKSGINTAFLIGGESIGKQNSHLKRNPRLVVGTPGRINDHLERGNLHLGDTEFLVLDETDRMLDMGFSVQIDRIVKHLPQERQTLMFSATLPKNILQMSKNYLSNPERISVGSTSNPIKNIKQEVIHIAHEKKYEELVRQLEARSGSIIVFVKTKYGTERLAKRLRAANFKADCIHGDLKQNRRDRVIKEFRNMKYRILVATDVAARGLDIPHIEHVINHDLPQVPEDYIHRIGRTARAGAEGSALCMVSPQDGRNWHAIQQLMDPDHKSDSAPKGKGRRKGGKWNDNKKPRTAGQSKGRSWNKDKPRSEGQSKDRNWSKDKPRSEGQNKDRSWSKDKPRSEGQNKDRNWNKDKPRSEGQNKDRNWNKDKPRSEGQNKDRSWSKDKPRSEGQNKDRNWSKDKPRSEGQNKDRSWSKDKPRSEGQNKDRNWNKDKPRSEGQNKDRNWNKDKPRSEGQNKDRNWSKDKPRSEGQNKDRNWSHNKERDQDQKKTSGENNNQNANQGQKRQRNWSYNSKSQNQERFQDGDKPYARKKTGKSDGKPSYSGNKQRNAA